MVFVLQDKQESPGYSVGMRTLSLFAGLSAVIVGAAYLTVKSVKGEIMATKEQFSAALDSVNAVLATIHSETSALVAEVQALRDQVASGEIPDDLMAKLDAITSKATEIDNLVPAAPVNPENPAPSPAPAPNPGDGTQAE